MIYESHVYVQCEHRMWFELSEEFEFKGGETKSSGSQEGNHCLVVLHSLVSCSFFVVIHRIQVFELPAGSIFRFCLSFSFDRTPNK